MSSEDASATPMEVDTDMGALASEDKKVNLTWHNQLYVYVEVVFGGTAFMYGGCVMVMYTWFKSSRSM